MIASSLKRISGYVPPWLAPLVLALLLGGCGGSGGGAPTNAGAPSTGICTAGDPAGECGAVMIAVTDADGDFVSYTVDVVSVALHRANGAIVETLPATARIDFAELTDLAELLSAATLAPGDIVGGTIRLDYENAEIYVESGGAIVPAIAVDDGGAPLGVVDLDIQLGDRNHLVVTRGRAAFLSIDFDLAASHEVDLSTQPAQVTTRPYLVAEVSPIVEKELRVRGALIEVADASYDVRVRPWHRRDGDFGVVTVHTLDSTTYEIDGASHTGADGLTALARLDAGALTVAFGTLDLQQRAFTAEIVHAGDSVGGEQFAAVHGNVVARTGDRLTVKGAVAVHRDRPARFRRTVVVDIGPDTAIGKGGEPGVLLDASAISVGQRIVALGQFMNPDDGDASADVPLVLDATQGRVRLLVTHLHGSVNGVLPGQLNLRLRAIDRLGIDLFDFAGTGASAAIDADPLDYEVSTGTLSLSGLENGEAARVFGFVAPFGTAPPDFMARVVVDHRDIPATLGIGWGPEGTDAPFLSMEPTGLVIDLANPQIGARHHLLLGRRVLDLFALPGSPAVQPVGTRGVYGLWAPGHVELFADFADFAAELALRIGGGDRVLALTAHGAYDESANAVAANRVVVHLLPQ